MASLILIVISIALLAAFIAASLDHVSAYANVRMSTQQGVNKHLLALESSVQRYFDNQRNAEGEIMYPGDNVDLSGAISPEYGFMPPRVWDLGWEVRTGAVYGLDAVGLCVKPDGAAPLARASQDALSALQAQLPVGSAFRGAACGATADTEGGDHLTYWVILLHLG